MAVMCGLYGLWRLGGFWSVAGVLAPCWTFESEMDVWWEGGGSWWAYLSLDRAFDRSIEAISILSKEMGMRV